MRDRDPGRRRFDLIADIRQMLRDILPLVVHSPPSMAAAMRALHLAPTTLG